MTGEERRPLRVAMVSFEFGELCVRTANALGTTAPVLLVLPASELAASPVAAGPGVELLAFAKPRLRRPLRQVRTCIAIVRRVRAWRPDVVHVQQGHLWLNLVLRWLPRPLVVTVHDPVAHPGDRDSRRTPQRVMELAFRQADRIVVHAEYVRRELVALLGRAAPPADVVPHIALGLPDGPPPDGDDGRTVLFFGRIWPYKGLEHLIAAQPSISAQAPGARIVIAGRGEDLDRYRGLMRDPSAFTVIDGYVPAEGRDELFARAAVVVLPYVEATQSGVVPVACAFARPVVASSVGGLPEVVDDGRTGLLVPPGDPEALAGAVGRLLADARLRRELGTAGRRRLDDEWSPERVAERTRRVYERALAA